VGLPQCLKTATAMSSFEVLLLPLLRRLKRHVPSNHGVGNETDE
jgi:hypothetical protein